MTGLSVVGGPTSQKWPKPTFLQKSANFFFLGTSMEDRRKLPVIYFLRSSLCVKTLGLYENSGIVRDFLSKHYTIVLSQAPVS